MRKILGAFFGFLIIFLAFTSQASAQNVTPAPNTFYRANVEAVTNQGEIISDTGTNKFEDLKVKFIDGDMKGKEMVIEYGKDQTLSNDQIINQGDTVVIIKTVNPGSSPTFQISDRYRLNSIWPVIIFFFLVVVLLSQWKGVGSIAGMVISLGVILKFIVPEILAGRDPLTISIIGALVIMITTIYLAHGFSTKTTIAVISTFITLVGIGILSSLFVKLAFLNGLGSEDAASLSYGVTGNIDFRGLLLGGILIGALGVLDDVTTGLSASVFELYKANPKLNFGSVFASGLSIGKEHISSLVNTLVLAYAGSALPIFLMITLNVNKSPLWLILNDQLIIEEVVRTLGGSLGLVAAVPLTTLFATFYITEIKNKKLQSG